MFFLNKSFKNIIRNKKWYIVVAMIAATVIISITISLAIYHTTSQIITDYTNRFGASVYFTPDLRKVINLPKDENGNISVPAITAEQLNSFSESNYLKSALFTASLQAYSENILGIDQDGQNQENLSPFIPSTENSIGLNRQIPNCYVIGYSDLSLMEDFALEQRELEEGVFFENLNECIISKDFAELNQLSLGDFISLYNVDDMAQFLLLEIVGIYYDGTVTQPNGSTWAVNNRRNEILVNYETVESNSKSGTVNIEATFFLKTPEYSKKFETEVREKGLPELYNVNVDDESYNQIVRPVKGLEKTSAILFVVVIIFGMIVLVLISILSVQKRKYEIGVLRAIGMKKHKIMFGFILESSIIFAASTILGLTIGLITARPVSNIILQDQIKIAYEIQNNLVPDYGNGVISNEINVPSDYSLLYDFELLISYDLILLIITISIFLGLISNSAGIIYVMRNEPMKILIERN